MNYIIVQAGGKGVRLKHFTVNKPKALVPFENSPIIFHLFKKFPEANFIIIGDYKIGVLKKYLLMYGSIKYHVIQADGIGTCAGIKKSLALVPPNKNFMIIWSDLVPNSKFNLENIDENKNYIGLSKTFQCRWCFKRNKFTETPSIENGVAGLFIFKNKLQLAECPDGGEFMRFISGSDITFSELPLAGIQEVGTLEELEKNASTRNMKCRPFNHIEVQGDIIIKTPITTKGENIAEFERDWYKRAVELNIKDIPVIYGYSPLRMEKMNAIPVFNKDLSIKDKKIVLKNIGQKLTEMHRLCRREADSFSILDAYFYKTVKRLNQIRHLLPFSNKDQIIVNDKLCKNIFYNFDKLEKRVTQLLLDVEFCFIHGDCTFSNILVDDELNVTFIDPRGYFGHTKYFGDPLYDWAKLYYSIVGNYDNFNNRMFRLLINDNDVALEIGSNGYETLENDFWSYAPKQATAEKIRLIHSVIWLSLTTYAWDDYDSICGAFFNGLYIISDIL